MPPRIPPELAPSPAREGGIDGTSESHAHSAEQQYQRRLELLSAEIVRLEHRHRTLGYTNLTVLIAGIIAVIWIVTSGHISLYWIFLPGCTFVFVATLHERVSRASDRHHRATEYYQRGLDRIHDRWAGKGKTGEEFADGSHPYARDLDLFGNGSMFQLLCDARTRVGEKTLASWLLAAASPDEVRSRNAAVADLSGRLDLREDLAVLGERLQEGVRPDPFVAWAEDRPLVASGRARVAAAILGVFWFSTWLAWIVCILASAWRYFWPLLGLALAASVVNALFSRAYRRWFDLVDRIDECCQGAGLLASAMARLERETFVNPRLIELQARLRAQGEAPSRSVARLARLVDWLASRRNMIIEFVDRYVFYTLETTFAIESWHKKFGSSVRSWIDAVGELEALCSLAAYRYEHPEDTFPEFTAETPCFECEGFAHPLLPLARAVPNDICLGGDLRLMIISGPNMAGKSTYLRAVGLNAVLAQSGAPVRARRLRLSPLQVAASVCVLDSLQGGISRFYAEILRLKMAMGLADGSIPVLFLLDELLGGTNSQDRRSGAQGIVKTLVDRGAIGMITTHDLALAEIVDVLGRRAANFHFEDRLEDGQLRFDYRLSPGVVRSSNALELMRSIGIDV